MLRAVSTFHGPGNLSVVEGELFDESDPVVAQFPTMFGPVTARRQVPGVEQASAVPGEKRSKR
jgi:hypothetical protein